MKNKIKSLIIGVATISLWFPGLSIGSNHTVNIGANGVLDGTVFDALKAIAEFLFQVATPLFVIAILIGAFMMMFSAGDPEKFGKGKQVLIYAIIAYVIILLAWGLPTLINSIITGG